MLVKVMVEDEERAGTDPAGGGGLGVRTFNPSQPLPSFYYKPYILKVYHMLLVCLNAHHAFYF